MTNHEETVQGSSYKDAKTGLVVFGIIQIIFGGFCALITPFMIFAMVASSVLGKSSAAPIGVRMMMPSVLVYVLLAVWFICMGIGSIKARRWARALILVSSWLWLISGLGGLIFVLSFMPNMYDKIGERGQMPQAAILIMKSVMIVFMTVIYVVIPAVFVFFYGRKNVKATCQFRDSQVRWTDKCPLPVLAVSFIFGLWAVSMLFMGFYKWTIPFFGFILTGVTGAAVALGVMFLSAYAAWGTYKLRINAWWCSVLLIIAWFVSTAITFSRISMWDFYEKMDLPREQLDIMREYNILQSSTMVLFFGIWFLGFMGYLLYVRRYFVHHSDQQSPLQQTLS